MSTTRPANVTRTRRKAIRNTLTSSHAKRTSPGSPVSAATVTGVSWEAAAFGLRPFRCFRFAYSRLKPPIPTPCTGWSSAMSVPVETSSNLPPDVAFSERWRTLGNASATTSTPAATTPTGIAARWRQTSHVTSTTPAISAMKLDCE
jgi:hypothetical protein